MSMFSPHADEKSGKVSESTHFTQLFMGLGESR